MAVFKPTGTLHCVTELTPELLKALHVHMIVLDVDNTMSPHGSQTPFPGVRAWAQSVTASGVKLIVVSNNYKKRVAPFAAQFNLPFVSFACKPFPVGYLRAKKMAGTPRRECLVVGDQIFTDILGANLCGMRSVLLDPLSPDPSATVRFKRRLEGFLRPHYTRLTAGEKTVKKQSIKGTFGYTLERGIINEQSDRTSYQFCHRRR